MLNPSQRPLILVLGAGASHGARRAAGDDPALAPPVGDRLAGYLLQWLSDNPPASSPIWALSRLRRPAHLDRVVEFLREVVRRPVSSGAAFEIIVAETLASLEEPERTYLFDDLNDVVCRAMLGGIGCRFAPREDLLDELLMVFGHRIAAVITFNYDTLTEEALLRRGFAFHYAGIERDIIGVPVFKEHGSSNWIAAPSAAVSADLDLARRLVIPTRVVEQADLGHSFERVVLALRDRAELIHDSGSQLLSTQEAPFVVATYGPGKFLVWCRSAIDEVRTACERFVSERSDSDVLVVGVRPPMGVESDEVWFNLRSLLARTTGSRHYVSPLAADCQEMAASRFQAEQATLEGFLASLRASSKAPTYEEIATAAYFRWLGRGKGHGRDVEDWLETERELRRRW